tara:strand:+ start:455 stop:808 length:354 start_codon:yes stop_codon:yes gene_type:complete
MKKKAFLSFDEILGKETSPELRRIKTAVDENAYWTSIFEKVLKSVANDDSQKILDAIVRIGEIKGDDTTKSHGELRLLVRLNSSTAAYKFKIYGPHILRYLNRLGLKVSSLQPSVAS